MMYPFFVDKGDLSLYNSLVEVEVSLCFLCFISECSYLCGKINSLSV